MIAQPPKEEPGAMGKAVIVKNPSPEVKRLILDGKKKNSFNQYVSDLISLHRSLPDARNDW